MYFSYIIIIIFLIIIHQMNNLPIRKLNDHQSTLVMQTTYNIHDLFIENQSLSQNLIRKHHKTYTQ